MSEGLEKADSIIGRLDVEQRSPHFSMPRRFPDLDVTGCADNRGSSAFPGRIDMEVRWPRDSWRAVPEVSLLVIER